MSVEDLLISTGVDNLIRLVHDAGRLELKDAAKSLGLSSASVEEWSRVLEEEGIIKIEYQLTKVYLVWVGSSQKEMAKKSEELADRKAELEKDIEMMIGKLGARGDELEKLGKDFKKISDLLDPKFGGAKRRLDALKEIEGVKDRLFDSHVGKMTKAKDEYRRINDTLGADEAKTRDMQKRVQEIQKGIEQLEPELAALGPMKKDMLELVSKLAEQAKYVSNALSAHKEQLSNLEMISKDLKERKASLGKMEERVGAMGGEMQELIGALEGMSKELDRQKKAQAGFEQEASQISEVESQREQLEELHEAVNREGKEVLRRAGSVIQVIEGLEGRFKELKKGGAGGERMPIEEYLRKIAEIKEKAKEDLKEVNSLDAKAMEDIAKAKTDLEKQLSEMKELTRTFEGIADRKREVDAVCEKIALMQDERRKLFSQLTLISKEIEFINIQSSPAGSPKRDLKVDELMGKIESVRKDQAEFDKRRTELRGMIEKMVTAERDKKGKG